MIHLISQAGAWFDGLDSTMAGAILLVLCGGLCAFWALLPRYEGKRPPTTPLWPDPQPEPVDPYLRDVQVFRAIQQARVLPFDTSTGKYVH